MIDNDDDPNLFRDVVLALLVIALVALLLTDPGIWPRMSP